MKNLLRHSLAAAAAAAILLVFYKIKELYPFGGNTVAWCDMNQQVIPLLCAFQDAVKEGSLFLSHGAAGGMNMWGVWLFFIASPFTLLTLLVEKADMAQFMNILFLFKIMLCAVSASVFFAKKHPRLHPVFGMLLSLSYAFCGYTMLFYQNIVWLDVMALFPWLLLSLDKLFSDGDFLPYTESKSDRSASHRCFSGAGSVFAPCLGNAPSSAGGPGAQGGDGVFSGGDAVGGLLAAQPFAGAFFRPGRLSDRQPFGRCLLYPLSHRGDAASLHRGASSCLCAGFDRPDAGWGRPRAKNASDAVFTASDGNGHRAGQ